MKPLPNQGGEGGHHKGTNGEVHPATGGQAAVVDDGEMN